MVAMLPRMVLCYAILQHVGDIHFIIKVCSQRTRVPLTTIDLASVATVMTDVFQIN